MCSSKTESIMISIRPSVHTAYFNSSRPSVHTAYYNSSRPSVHTAYYNPSRRPSTRPTITQVIRPSTRPTITQVSFGQIWIRVITKLLNSEQSFKGKVKPHKYINRQNQKTNYICLCKISRQNSCYLWIIINWNKKIVNQ